MSTVAAPEADRARQETTDEREIVGLRDDQGNDEHGKQHSEYRFIEYRERREFRVEQFREQLTTNHQAAKAQEEGQKTAEQHGGLRGSETRRATATVKFERGQRTTERGFFKTVRAGLLRATLRSRASP